MGTKQNGVSCVFVRSLSGRQRVFNAFCTNLRMITERDKAGGVRGRAEGEKRRGEVTDVRVTLTKCNDVRARDTYAWGGVR